MKSKQIIKIIKLFKNSWTAWETWKEKKKRCLGVQTITYDSEATEV